MRSYRYLFRTKISIMVGLSAFAGACLSDSSFGLAHVLAVLSSVFLAAGSSALNQYQEAEEDAQMNRTKRRPIPNGDMTPWHVLKASMAAIGISIFLMLLTGSLRGLILIIATVLIYNFIYTPLKKITPFALLVGSVTGAIPPMLGYTAVGGSYSDPPVLMVCAVLFIWQTPHFAMLAEKYSDDYARAGFITLSAKYGKYKSGLFIKVWLIAFICALFLIPMTGVYIHQAAGWVHLGISVMSALLIALSLRYTTRAFHVLNSCMILFFVLLVVDRIII